MRGAQLAWDTARRVESVEWEVCAVYSVLLPARDVAPHLEEGVSAGEMEGRTASAASPSFRDSGGR